MVRWIFAQRLAGHSVARIARALNEAGVPCPSAADPARNTHRSGTSWTLGTVTTILENPRYTGRQVWNRQRTDTELADPANVTLGHKSVQRWNLPDGWVISSRPAHPALVSEDDFIAAQGINAARGPVPQDAACAGGGWNQRGPTAGPRTGAGTGAPARWRRTRPARRTPTSARTSCCRTCPPCTSCSPARPYGPGAAPEPTPMSGAP